MEGDESTGSGKEHKRVKQPEIKQDAKVGIVGNLRAHSKKANGYDLATGLCCWVGRRLALPDLPILQEKIEF